MAAESTSGEKGEQRTQSEKRAEARAQAQGQAQGQAQRREQGARQGAPLQRREELTGLFGFPTPFSLMRRLFDDMDRVFEQYVPGRFGAGTGELAGRDVPRLAREGFWIPQIDVFERDRKLVVRADLPGMKPQDVRCEIENDTLVIEGERRREVEEERGGRYRTERTYGSFRRAIPLPEGADAEHAEARFENGVLEVAIPVPQERAGRKQIEIQGGEQKPSVH